jgi:tetratricopeptide (TPR) repeat protein
VLKQIGTLTRVTRANVLALNAELVGASPTAEALTAFPVKEESGPVSRAHVDPSAATERILSRAESVVHAAQSPICWVCQFADCEEHPEEPLLSTGCACCRPGSSGGQAHVSCLISAAAHQSKLWLQCPTCKQDFTGAVRMELARAHWELCRQRPEADFERLVALSNRAASLVESGDDAAARPLYEELVAVQRRTQGNDHPHTLEDIGRLAGVLSETGENAEAQSLLEEAVAGLRLTMGDEAEVTLDTVETLAAVHGRLGAWAKARLLFEEVAVGYRRTAPVAPRTFTTIGNLGNALMQAGDITAALALREEAAASALRELGPDHPTTQQTTNTLERLWHELLLYPSGTRAVGTLVGLASKPELNGKDAYVVGFDAGKGRYRVHHEGFCRTGKPIGIKPASLIFNQGLAVIVEGLDAAPEWNGKRGLVESYDAAKGRYRLLVKGRTKPLGVRVACCKLEFAVEQEQREHEATRRARVEANVRAALAARESEPEPEPEPESQPQPQPGAARA